MHGKESDTIPFGLGLLLPVSAAPDHSFSFDLEDGEVDYYEFVVPTGTTSITIYYEYTIDTFRSNPFELMIKAEEDFNEQDPSIGFSIWEEDDFGNGTQHDETTIYQDFVDNGTYYFVAYADNGFPFTVDVTLTFGTEEPVPMSMVPVITGIIFVAILVRYKLSSKR